LEATPKEFLIATTLTSELINDLKILYCMKVLENCNPFSHHQPISMLICKNLRRGNGVLLNFHVVLVLTPSYENRINFRD
jgi:hypothetical protein